MPKIPKRRRKSYANYRPPLRAVKRLNAYLKQREHNKPIELVTPQLPFTVAEPDVIEPSNIYTDKISSIVNFLETSEAAKPEAAESSDSAIDALLATIKKQKQGIETSSSVVHEAATQYKHFPRAQYVKIWDKLVKEGKAALLPSAVKALASAEAVAQTNDDLKFGLGLDNAQIDVGFSSKITSALFSVDYLIESLSNFNWDEETKRSIIDRVIAQVLPTKDGADLAARKREADLIRSMRSIAKDAASQASEQTRQLAAPQRNVKDEKVKKANPRFKAGKESQAKA